MAKIDPEAERRRLRDFYASLTDGELCKLAADEGSLTDVARQVLRYELTLRKLDGQTQDDAGQGSNLLTALQAPPVRDDNPEAGGDADDEAEADGEADDEADESESDPVPGSGISTSSSPLVTIRQFRDLPEAFLAKGSLESAGIECHLGDDNIVRLDWFYSNLVGGVKLQVRPKDVEAANEILSQPIPEGFEVDGVGNYEQPRCPECGSFDVAFEALNKPVAYTGAYFSLPLPIHNRGWKCHACKHSWGQENSGEIQNP
jgi:hypothetical protein